MMSKGYEPDQVARYFDQYGVAEWNRMTATPVAEVSLHIHRHYLTQHMTPGMRVLEIGAGAGRFTQVLAELGTRVLVGDLSQEQLRINREHAQRYDFVSAVEDWLRIDICDMSTLATGDFDAVVAYGGPLSYVLEQRDVALQECLRVLKPDGLLFLSVMSLWGSAHRGLKGVLEIPVETNRKIIATGDISPVTYPGRDNYMHLFRADELRNWLEAAGVQMLVLSASSFLSLNWDDTLADIRNDPETWQELLNLEVEACAEAGSLNAGTHILAVVRKSSSGL
jgi:2-polyprenyl-3-methyl-5-hydroxy-6-metoxy-1,4-benzoquinol methylase